MSYYQRHLFVCCHRRAPESTSCAARDAESLLAAARERVNALGIRGHGMVRVSSAGCLGRCLKAPVAVVYPDAVWYRCNNVADMLEIVDQHLAGGHIVERLLLPAQETARINTGNTTP